MSESNRTSNERLDLSEIRARLEYARSAQADRPFARPSFCADIQDLLAEIERLRADIAKWKLRVADDDQREQRLRAALVGIRETKVLTDCGIDPLRAAGLRQAFEITREIAVKALEGQHVETGGGHPK